MHAAADLRANRSHPGSIVSFPYGSLSQSLDASAEISKTIRDGERALAVAQKGGLKNFYAFGKQCSPAKR
jgi:hypothetical protein